MITLTREEAQQVLDALEHSNAREPIWKTPIREARETLRARLSAPEPEPIAYKVGDATVYIKPPIYTAPPQREWQGLTDEEKNEITWGKTVYEILDLAEAKLKEKNT